MGKITVKAAAVRVGDKLVRKSDGFLFKVRRVSKAGTDVTIHCAGIEPVTKKRHEKVGIFRSSRQHELPPRLRG